MRFTNFSTKIILHTVIEFMAFNQRTNNFCDFKWIVKYDRY